MGLPYIYVCTTQDWWNSQCLGEYLGKWNPVIQEWLKTYFYAYLKNWVPRAVALLAILVLSAAEHDFLIGTGMGFYIPMYLVEYGLIGTVCPIMSRVTMIHSPKFKTQTAL